MVNMEITELSTQSAKLHLLEKRTVFYSSSGKSLSRIELYQSGANRIIRKSTLPMSEIVPERSQNDIREFSHSTRRRYFYYINSLDLSEMKSSFFITFTISSNLDEYLTKDGMKSAYESIFKKLKKLEFDHVYKIEYTLGCEYEREFRRKTGKSCSSNCVQGEKICEYHHQKKPIPHLHLLVFSKNTYGFNNDSDRIDKSRELSLLWTDSVFDNNGISIARFYTDGLNEVYNHMSQVSCQLEIPQDLKKLIFYFADYTSKNKDYQNVIPEKYWGTRTWGKRASVYGKLRRDPVYIDISQDIFDEIYRCIVLQWKKEKAKKCAAKRRKCHKCTGIRKESCNLYRKNGFYHPAPLLLLDGFLKTGRFQSMIYENEYMENLKDIDPNLYALKIAEQSMEEYRSTEEYKLQGKFKNLLVSKNFQ